MRGIALLVLATAVTGALEPPRAGTTSAGPTADQRSVAFQADTTLARVESLLVARRLPQARQLAESLLATRAQDARLLVLLGRIHLEWPVIGRYRADTLFRRAADLDSLSPEPPYWTGQVGLRLGGDDGESLARRGLVRVLALDPRYRDAWALWLTLYRSHRERDAALAALAPFRNDPAVDQWTALLLIEQRRYSEAEGILRTALRRNRVDPAPRALLARALFEQGHDADGAAEYEAALRTADADTGEVLWRQVRSIASPQERVAWTRTAPAGREAFLRLFWARREPDVRSAANERLGEHFRRMREAQRTFAVLHPNSLYHRSAIYRRRMGLGWTIPADRALERTVSRARETPCTADLPDGDDPRYAAGLTAPVQPGGEATSNLEDGLDDRGRIFVRHGRPDVRLVHGLDGETWCYVRPEGVFRVTFLRLGGDMVIRPVAGGEAESASHLLATDRPTVHEATLEWSFWPASFRAGRDGARTELVLFPDSVNAVAVLVDAAGRTVVRDSGFGRALHLTAPPGRYVLLADADRRGRFGSYRGPITLPDYEPDRLSISSLLVADGATPANRAALEAAAPRRLRLDGDSTMRFYAEIYGLAADGARTGRYEARYVFERDERSFLGLFGSRERTITVAFEREVAWDDPVHESLVVDPGRLPDGHYRLRLEVIDRTRRTRAASAVLEFDLR